MPDSWERFERAAGVVAKTALQHRVAKKTAAKKTKRLKLERVLIRPSIGQALAFNALQQCCGVHGVNDSRAKDSGLIWGGPAHLAALGLSCRHTVTTRIVSLSDVGPMERGHEQAKEDNRAA